MSRRSLFDNVDATPTPAGLECERCGSDRVVDVRLNHAPHNGRSVRRDCARCGKTLGFPEWYGQAHGVGDFLPGGRAPDRRPKRSLFPASFEGGGSPDA